MGYYSAMQKKLQAKGGFKHGERVRIKPEFRGKTYVTKKRRGGEWILSDFKTTNWVLKRPPDYVGYHTQSVLAKPHMIERVYTAQAPAVVDAVSLITPPTLTESTYEFKNDYASFKSSSSLQQMSQYVKLGDVPYVDVVGYHNHDTQSVGYNDDSIVPPLTPGTVVIIKNPDHPKKYKGLWTILACVPGLTTVGVAPLFGGAATSVNVEFITVIPEKDLTIVYLPQ